MTAWHALLLGLLQGVTELLPISSSGHLVLAEHVLAVGIPGDLLGFDVMLHLGSLLALIVCYPMTWARMLASPFTHDRTYGKLLLFLIVASVPAAVAGVFLEDVIAESTRAPFFVATGFLFTGVILIAAERMPERRTSASLWLRDVLLIGVAQACALPPGISRSGLTVSAGRALGLTRTAAVDFSFLMAVPVIGGAALFTGVELMRGTVGLPSVSATLIGMLASFGSSILAILFFRRLVRTRSTAWFALYLIPLGLILLAV